MSTVLAPAVLVQCSYILVGVGVTGFVATVEQKFPTLIVNQTLTKVHQLI